MNFFISFFFKKKIFFFYILFLFFLIELFSYFLVKFLIKKSVFYEPSYIKQSYEDYVNVYDPVLGWKNKNGDVYGARFDGSNFSNSSPCVDVYGDSYTYSYEVNDMDTWASKLSDKLKCRVRNFGVIGYGTDQSFLRFYNSNNFSKVVILNSTSEDIIRNVNQFLNFIYTSEEIKFKPRFIIQDNNLNLIKIQLPSKIEFNNFLKSPEYFLNYDYFIPGKRSGVTRVSIPFFFSLIRSLDHFHIKAIINKKSRLEEFYNFNHTSQSLELMEMIIKEFVKSAKVKSSTPIITIMPTCRDFMHKNRHGFFPYANLSNILNKSDFLFIDFGLEILSKKIDYKKLYLNCSTHMNSLGNQIISDIFEEKIKTSIINFK